MKIAYLMNGLVGGLSGKNCQRTDNDITHLILELCAKTHKHIHNDNVDIDYFIFSWEPNLDSIYDKLFNPKSYKSEIQKKFKVPKHYDNLKDDLRIQSHYARWYGAKEVYNMCLNYSTEKNIHYDLVVNARIDMYYHQNLDFSKWEPDKFNIGKTLSKPNYNWPNRNELVDHFFASNFENMGKFLYIYDFLNQYTMPGQCPSWNNISSHMLIVWHLRKLGLLSTDIIKEKLTTRFDNKSGVDYHIFRYQKLDRKQLLNILNYNNK